ncbi:MAG: hypothetical protein DWQ05_21895 [Calditrichaeota bacterium]|nr:MAG: hypothetical protein DWQ05_21895 [Calditrichota bacterium]
MFKPYMNVTDEYGKIICRVINLLGDIPPINDRDKAIRDLAADVFDALYESRNLIISGKCIVSFPLARRAYESLSLMVVFALDNKIAKKWMSGKQINNHTVRQLLSKHPMGEKEEMTRDFYKFFSSASHPNRDLVPYRYLGEGNKFVLGSIGQPDLLMTTDFCKKHLGLWFWFVAFFMTHYQKQIHHFDDSCNDLYMKTANEAKKVNNWFIESFNKLLEQYKENLTSGS